MSDSKLSAGKTLWNSGRGGPSAFDDLRGAPLLALAASLLSAQRRTHSKSITTQAVEVRKVLEPRRSVLERSLITLPDLPIEDPWPQISTWMEPLLRP